MMVTDKEFINTSGDVLKKIDFSVCEFNVGNITRLLFGILFRY